MTGADDKKGQIRVLFVKSHEEDRDTLKAFISNIQGVLLIDTVASARAALEKLKDKSADVVLVDFSKTDSSAIDLTMQIREAHPKTRVLIITENNTAYDIFAALEAGADGYLLKENLSNALEMAIGSVRLGAVWLDPGIAQQMLEIVKTPITKSARVLPTGYMPLPLMPHEALALEEVASSSCVDGVCMIDPAFLKKLKRFAPAS